MKQLLAAVTVLTVSTAQAGTLSVDVLNCPGPGDGSIGDPYCSIQTAIDNAVDTDEVLVAPGTYFEAINFLGKAITLRSSNGAGVTIIDGTGNLHVVQCVSGERRDTVLDGFTITGGNADGVGYPDSRGGGMINDFSSPTVTNCTFAWNSAHVGGGMYNNFDSSPAVTNCTFSGNLANVGGGMSNIHGFSTVTNCTFSGNTAVGPGGGMYNDGDVPTITNCTFTGNSAGFGGGMSNDLSSPTVTNCIFWGDSPDEIFDFGTATITFSNVQGGLPGTGNIDADPLFVAVSDCCIATPFTQPGCSDPACESAVCDVAPECCDVAWDPGCAELAAGLCSICPNDYRLSTGSPCIDAGHNWAIAGITDTDLDGNPRFAADKIDFDPGCGIPVVVDMGAYEYQGDPFPVKLGDINGDGVVGINDFLDLLADWGSCTQTCCLSDLDLDGAVGILDLLILLGNWR